MSHSITLQEDEIRRLKDYLRRHRLRAVLAEGGYEFFRVDEGEVNMILYKSGKLVYNENPWTREIVDEILEVEEGYDYLLGTDEAGKGEWYGPLVVECVALKPGEVDELRRLGVRDSKSLTRKRLRELGSRLVKLDFIRKPLILMPESYNRAYGRFQEEGKTLNDVLAWAHARALKDLISILEYEKLKIVIDKFDVMRTEFRLGDLDKTGMTIIQKTGGESEIPVAAASILAKYIFEEKVDELDERFNLNLRGSRPEDIPQEIVPRVAKLHFRNVRKVTG
jgi:ribonuclease HIII